MDNAYKDSMKLKEVLIKTLTKKQLEKAPSSFDVIGSKENAIAIVEIDKALLKKQKHIAEAIMSLHKNVSSVLRKDSARKGKYRTRDMKIIKGTRKTEVVHVENGCRFFLDPRKVYFSPREGTERLRLAQLVHGNTMVFFAGVGAFPIVLAKHAHVACVGIEINPIAFEYFKKNIALNKAHNVIAVEGDVKDNAKTHAHLFDHVILPLPETAAMYTKEAALCLKGKGTAHVYFFAAEHEAEEKAWRIQKKMSRYVNSSTVVRTQKVLPYGPRIWKYRTDISIEKESRR